MTKRLIAFLMVLMIAFSIASLALADVFLDVYTAVPGVCAFDERGDWSPEPPLYAPAGGRPGPGGKVENRVNMLY